MRISFALALAACGHHPSTTIGGDASRSGDAHTIDATTDGSSSIAYDSDGPIAYTTQTAQISAGGRTFTVTLYLPSSPGPHPAVSFACGTQQTAAGYATYGKRLASYGIAMALVDDAGVLVNTADIVPGALYVVQSYLPSLGSIDTTKIGLGGHSRGGAVSLLAAEQLHGAAAAWFGLDPVDNEFGQAPREYARTNLASLAIPTAYLGAGVTSNCAPTADSYETLYPISPSPSVLVVGLGAGHTQLELASGCSACNVCSPAGTASSDVVLAYATRYLTAFFARELLGDASVGAAFQGAGAAQDVAAQRVTVTAK